MNERTQADIGKLLLRLTVGGLLLFHGISKLRNGIGGIESSLSDKGLPELFAYGVYVGEVIAPIFLVVGKFTRLAAVICAFNMVVAILLAHFGDIARLDEHGAWAIEHPMLFLLPAVSIALLGAGRYSLSKGHGRWD